MEANKRIDSQESHRGIGTNLKDGIENGIVHYVNTNDGSLDDLKERLQKSLNDPNFRRKKKEPSQKN